MNPGKALYLTCPLLILLLSSCSIMFKDEETREKDRIELEHSRALVYGSSGAAFSPSGSLVAIANRETIWVADTASGKVKTRLLRSRAAPFGSSKGLVFVDEQRLVIGAEGVLMIWDLKEGLVTHRLNLPNKMQSPRALAWSESTQSVALSIAGWGEPVKVVPVKADGFGRMRDVFEFEAVPADLVFSRDGRYIAAAGDESGVFIREVDTGDLAGELPTDGYVSSMQQFGDNQLLVSGNNIGVWSFFSEQQVQEFQNPDLQGQINSQITARVAGGVALGVVAIAMLPLLVFGGGGGDFYVETYKAEQRLIKTPLVGQQPWCSRSTSISRDGTMLVDIYPGTSKEVIGVYSMADGSVIKKLDPRGEYSCVVKFSPDGASLLITSDKVARLYNTETWRYRDLDITRSR